MMLLLGEMRYTLLKYVYVTSHTNVLNVFATKENTIEANLSVVELHVFATEENTLEANL